MVSGVKSRIFVGDLQGCAAELDALIEALEFDPQRHELWFVGDLVNRGPKSARTLRRVIELGGNSVLGNHDLHLLASAAGSRAISARDTLQEVLESPDRDELVDWLRHRPLVQEWDDLLLVHAGVHPKWRDPKAVAAPLEAAIRRGELPLRDPDLAFMTRVRHCSASGERPPDDLAPGKKFAPWDTHYRGKKLVVCGHWSARGIVSAKRVRSIDTGCVWGRELTAWNAEEDRFIRVPALRQYASFR